jgi:hypothetical protein
MQALRLPLNLFQFERGDLLGSHPQAAKAQGHSKVPLPNRLGAIKAFQEATQFRIGESFWWRRGGAWRWANDGLLQLWLQPTLKMEKTQKVPQRRGEHVQRTASQARARAHEAIQILRLKRSETQASLAKAPSQKLLDEEPIDVTGCLRQTGDLIEMPVILVAQPLKPLSALCWFSYPQVSNGHPGQSAKSLSFRRNHSKRGKPTDAQHFAIPPVTSFSRHRKEIITAPEKGSQDN